MLRIKPRKKYRNFLIIYISRYTIAKKKSGNPNFFKFRINSNNYQPILNRIERNGFKINSVFYEFIDRKSGISSAIRLK